MMSKKYGIASALVALTLISFALASFLYGLPFSASRAYASTDVRGLPEAEPSETLELQDGDSYDLVAGYVKKEIKGTWYRMLAYNGSIPGPLIKIPEGAEVTINFKNDTDMPTLLHSHGVRMDNAFDGAQNTQEEIQPGKTFSYTLKFPDAGMYWYHPHVREDFQQELGMYGNYLVTPVDPEYWSPVNREIPMILDDVYIENGQIPLNKDKVDRTLMGRFGNVMLINGETDYVLRAQKGEVVRLYITNVANVRPFNFAIEGGRMKLVGGDSGAYERDSFADSVIIGPSERAIVEVLFDTPGTYAIQNATPEKAIAFGGVEVSNTPVAQSYFSQFQTLKIYSATVASIDPFRSKFTAEPDKRLRLSLEMSAEMQSMMGGDMSGMQGMEGMNMSAVPEGGIEWDEGDSEMMNRMSNAENVKWDMIDEATGKKNMDIQWAFKQGEPVKIRITNDAKSMHPMQHPIHFHGQRFLVVARDGVPQTNLVWKDTVQIKAGETIDVVLDPSNPGTWMAHCHIPEHMESGMMMTFTVGAEALDNIAVPQNERVIPGLPDMKSMEHSQMVM